MEKNLKNTRALVEGGLLLALSLLFDQFKAFELPFGGSLTLQALPIIIYSVRWGLTRGMFLGFVFGVLSIFLGGYVIHPVQGALDYPIAYMFLGLSALLVSRDKSYKSIALSVVIAFACKVLSHVLSGFIFFKDTVPAGKNMALYMFEYNLSFTIPEVIVTLVVLAILMNTAKNRIFNV